MTELHITAKTDPHAQCVIEAVQGTLGMFCDEEPAFIDAPVHDLDGDHVVGIVSLLGERSWSLMLCIPRATAGPLSEKFAGFEIEFDSDDMGDVIGELCNVFAGSVSAKLEGIGAHVELSLPTVVRGTRISIPHPEGLREVHMDFQAPEGPFCVKMVAGDPQSLPGRRSGS